MKRLLSIAALALITTSVSSAPAFAQFWNSNINQTQAQMQYRIQRGIQSGRLTRSEARRLQHRMNEVARLEDRFRRHGLSFSERARLQNRLAMLNNQLNRELNDFERRGLAGRNNRWW